MAQRKGINRDKSEEQDAESSPKKKASRPLYDQLKAPDEGIPTEKLPPEERLVSRSYGLEDVFGDGPEGTKQEMNSFYDLTTWDGYVKLVSSELGKRIKRPNTNTMYRGRNT